MFKIYQLGNYVGGIQMRNTIFNNCINRYAYFYNRLITEIKAYEKVKREYRALFVANYGIYQKSSSCLPFITLTPTSKKIILKEKAEICKIKKENVKTAQRDFEKYRNQVVKIFKENGLTIYN